MFPETRRLSETTENFPRFAQGHIGNQWWHRDRCVKAAGGPSCALITTHSPSGFTPNSEPLLTSAGPACARQLPGLAHRVDSLSVLAGPARAWKRQTTGFVQTTVLVHKG